MITITAGTAPVAVQLGSGGSIVTNRGSSTVSYTATHGSTTPTSTIAASASATLYGKQYFFCASGSTELAIVFTGGSINVGGATLFIGTADPGTSAAEGDVWIDTSS